MGQYLRVLEVGGLIKAGSFFLQPLPNGAIPAVGPWVAALGAVPTSELGSARAALDPVRMRISGNTTTPFGENDDAMWQGRGLNLALDGGATLTWRHLSITAHPTLTYSQNQSFPLAPVSLPGATAYAYPWWLIDLPQRFGPNPFARLDPGQSNVKLTVRGATLGFGTENLWWGPGIQTSILMTNDGPGFPHASLSTSKPADIGIGTVEAQWIWGRLQESGWYTEQHAGWGRFFTGAEVAFSPSLSFFKGLTLGGARVFTQNVPSGGLAVSDYLAILRPGTKRTFATAANPTGEDERDQILSLQFRWLLPESGFEYYGEWARNDFAWDLTDFLLEPEHSQAYALGFQRVRSLAHGQILALNGEVTHLERDPSFLVRGDPPYYTHYLILQGYTQRGQMIGSALGPGGDRQYLGADLYTARGRWGIYGQRQVHDNDAYYEKRTVAPKDTTWAHDVSITIGSRALVFTRGLEVELDAALTREWNRYLQVGNDVWNGHAGVTLRWRPR